MCSWSILGGLLAVVAVVRFRGLGFRALVVVVVLVVVLLVLVVVVLYHCLASRSLFGSV